MSNLTILNTTIRQNENLFNLNDLHAISGNESKHRPTFFVRLDTTQELVAEIQKEDENKPVLIRKNGIGTYACMEIALAYAMWIDPKFHLIVLRAYMAMHKGEVQNSQPNLPLVEEKKFTFKLTQDEISTLLWLWFIAEKERDLIDNLAPALRSIGSHFAPTAESHATEYKFSIERARKILLNLSQTLNVTPWEDTNLSRVLPKIRNFNSGNPQRPRLIRR